MRELRKKVDRNPFKFYSILLMKKMLSLLTISVVLFSGVVAFSQSFESNYSNALKFISLGKRIQAQKHIQSCLLSAESAKNYLKVANLYHSIQPNDAKVHEYLAKAYQKIESASDSLETAKEYLRMLDNKRMAQMSLSKGLSVAKSLKDMFLVARGFKTLLDDGVSTNQALIQARRFAMTLEDWIQISDISYTEFSSTDVAAYALDRCWTVANNREEWFALSDAYKRIGFTLKARLAYDRGHASIW